MTRLGPAPRLHEFDGQQLTIAEIKKLIPVVSESSIRQHLEAGRNTREAILNYRPKWAKPMDSSRFPRKS